MCGITGILHFNDLPVPRETVEKMTAALRHRGPDDEGYFTSGPVAFGFRRLAIIDLTTGHQPMHNEDKTIWVMLNGEIYNYAELREELLKKGHVFYTKSDTEVIVHLYEDHGERFLGMLNGMFAIALWDDRNRTLFLARDRFGKKPLHYCLLPDKMIFASEIKALLRHPDCPRELDYLSLAKYLHMEYVPAPCSIYRGVRKVSPSEYLVCRDGRVRISSYWDLPYNKQKLALSFGEAKEELLRLLSLSVNQRLIADVPLGVFLSGGIDSSSVAAVAARHSSVPVKTFSISFSDPRYDEAPAARKVAKFLGTDHHEDSFSPETVFDLLPNVAAFLDEPLADPSLLPTYLLSRFARNKVTVALGGDGGDELFAGYPTYLAHRWAAYYDRLPRLFRDPLRSLVSRLPVSTSYFSFDFKAKRFMRGDGYPLPQRHARWMSAFLPQELASLLTSDTFAQISLRDIYSELCRYDLAAIPDPIERAMYIDARMYLQDDVLAKVDRASMAVSLEVRAPLLDHRVAEFVAQLPLSFKLHRFTSKYILRNALADLLPREPLHQKKHGFNLPLSRWLRRELIPLLEHYLNPRKIDSEGIFDSRYVQRIIGEHREGRVEHRKTLWSLLVFEMWRERYG